MRKIKLISEPKAFDLEALIPEIRIICRDYGIDLLYLFGGAAKSSFSDLSDIDIAFYSNNNLIGKSILARNQALVEALKRDDVDLVDLKTANPYICYRAIKDGKRLFCSKPEIVVSIESAIQNKFLNTIFLRNKFHTYQYNAIMKGGFYVSTG